MRSPGLEYKKSAPDKRKPARKTQTIPYLYIILMEMSTKKRKGVKR